jgi:hypothetical protein
VKFLLPEPEKFSIHARAWPGRIRDCHEP